MQLLIIGINFELTPALYDYGEKRALGALSRFHDRIGRVEVKLEDINGPRGGVDKLCKMYVSFRRRGEVLVEHRHEDLYAAIDLAAGRLRRQIARHVEQMNQRGRSRTPAFRLLYRDWESSAVSA